MKPREKDIIVKEEVAVYFADLSLPCLFYI